MDEYKVREHAEAHGRAIVAGDLARAAGDLDEAVKDKAPSVMKRLPRPVTASEITSIVAGSDAFVVHTRYTGDGDVTMVEARWAEVEGRPLIVDLDVVPRP
jgi:poly(3-hydroxybutyrate) depolymerase